VSLLSEPVNKKLDELLTACFAGNGLCDRAMSVLDVKFVMNKTVSILHPGIAHLFPKLGDVVSEFQSDRNQTSIYGMIPLDATDYDSPQDFFEKLLEFVEDLESLTYDVKQISLDENDHTAVAFIDDFIEILMPLTKQCLLLVDKGNAYKGDWMRFDHDIEDFFILSNFVNGDWEDD
jgi:hypothetical protein